MSATRRTHATRHAGMRSVRPPPATPIRSAVRNPEHPTRHHLPGPSGRPTTPRHDSGRNARPEEGPEAMNTSRRRAIKLGMCATASLVTLEGLCEQVVHAAAGENPAPVMDDASWLRRDLFDGCRGQLFVVRTFPRSIGLQLMSVDDVPSARLASAADDPNSFIVRFRGPRSPKLAQGTYQIRSDALGAFPLFLVPGGTSAYGTTYTATFNRL